MMKDHNYLIFQPVFNYFQVFSGTTDKICNSCKVKQQFYSRTCLYSYLQNSIMICRKLFKTRQIMFYSQKGSKRFYCLWLNIWSRDLNTGFMLKDCLFEAVKLTESANSDKYSYSGYRIGFDSRSLVSNFHFGNSRK